MWNISGALAMLRGLVLLSIVSGLSLTAAADISSYNDALKRGDLRAAAAAAEVTWAEWDMSDSSTPLIGREFAFTSLRAGATEAAVAIIEDVLEQAPPEKEIDQKVLRLIAAQARALATDNESIERAVVVEELEDISGYDGPVSAIALYVVTEQAVSMGESSSTFAAPYYNASSALWRKAGTKYLPEWLDAETRLALANYRTIDDFLPHARLRSALNVYAREWRKNYDSLDIERMRQKGFAALAWADAMASNLRTEQVNNQFFDDATLAMPMHSAAEQAGLCKIKATNKTPIRFKQTGSNIGTDRFSQGSAIVLVDVTAKGKTENVRIVAVAPRKFSMERGIKRAVKTWRWEVEDDESEPGCSIAQTDKIIRIGSYYQVY